MFYLWPLTNMRRNFRKFLVCTLLFFQAAIISKAKPASAGLAWHVQGKWQVSGKDGPVRAGDAIEPTVAPDIMRSP